MSHSWAFTTGQLILLYCSSIILGFCIAMVVLNTGSSINTVMGTIAYALVALVMLIVTFGVLRQARGALKQRYEIRRRMVG
jgi:hypothetical protein